MADLNAALGAAMEADPHLRHVQSVIVRRRGDVLAERYYRGRTAHDLSNVHSITKSVLATLVGIAVAERTLGLETPAVEVLPGGAVADPRKALITVRHLLTMTSGLAADGGHDIDEIADRGESWVAGPLAAPLVAAPGTTFTYNNGAAHVLSVLLATKARRPLLRLAEERLFAPLGIDDYRWPADPDGNPLGYGHLELRPRDLAALGDLYLRRGRVGGTQLLPGEYVDAATTAATSGGPPEGMPYGFLWWVTQTASLPSFFAGGFGGQYLSVVPALELVVATTADAAVWTPTSANPRRLVEEVVVPALGI
jgi:CubicO group peptidase (beta-lactamase class C family)